MTKTTEANAASILAKLRNLARNQFPNLPANTMLLLYAQQGLLARLEGSSYTDHFVLKGALSLFARYGDAARPTEDIDLAARNLPNTSEAISRVIAEICSHPYADGLRFEVEDIQARTINETLQYPGVSLMVRAVLGRSHVDVQLDVSFGNAITPGPVELRFPTMLVEPAVRIKAYPLETVIAEKFAALAEIGEATTRMKDLYDLHTILAHQTFEAELMRLAFERSFQARKTSTEAIRLVLEEDFTQSDDLNKRWRQYLARTRFKAPDYGTVMGGIQRFCRPLLLEDLRRGRWHPAQGWHNN
jgi:predicted nucleotidyltransferase component of viral defense system